MNYYNEFDPNAAAWLRGLIEENLIPAGEVDTRSICDVAPADLAGYTQCHFFAGISGWSLALALAGVPTSRPLWTGSCPCQPFSVAGKGKGTEDERHLWPVWFHLIAACRPQLVFGEQVASPDALDWFDGVSANLEGEGYACGAVIIGAHSVGADHQRQRLYWMADSAGDRCGKECADSRRSNGRSDSKGRSARLGMRGAVGSMADSEEAPIGFKDSIQPGGCREDNFWSGAVPILCRDGKYRRIPAERSLFPLANGLSGRVARGWSFRNALLKGAGNAIVPQVAAEFIKAAFACIADL